MRQGLSNAAEYLGRLAISEPSVLSQTLITSPGIKFRRTCLLSCCGGRGVQESAFSLAWLAEELITWNKFIIL